MMDKTEQPSIISGWWSSPDPSHHFDVEEPATGKVIARVQGAGAKEMNEAVVRSHRAFSSSWRHLPPRERARLMRLAAERLREHADEIATLESREVGKPYEISRYTDMFICAEAFDYFAGLADKLHGSFYPGGPIDSYTLLEPYGVVGAIVPFNWPPIHTGSKIAPAIAAGNTVVLKPPEQSPLCVHAHCGGSSGGLAHRCGAGGARNRSRGGKRSGEPPLGAPDLLYRLSRDRPPRTESRGRELHRRPPRTGREEPAPRLCRRRPGLGGAGGGGGQLL